MAAVFSTTATAQDNTQYVPRSEYDALLKRIEKLEQEQAPQHTPTFSEGTAVQRQDAADERDRQIIEDNDCGVIPIAGRQGFALQRKTAGSPSNPI